MSHKQDLFRDFIVAASKLYGEALMSSEPKPQELVEIHAMISRMRVLCSPQTVECAEKVMATTIDALFAPDKTIRELDEAIKSGAGIDPLTQFSLAARKELRGFYDF